VRNEVLQRVKWERVCSTYNKKKNACRIGHILRVHCLLKHDTEGKEKGRIEMTGRRARRRRQLLDNLQETGRYWKLNLETLRG